MSKYDTIAKSVDDIISEARAAAAIQNSSGDPTAARKRPSRPKPKLPPKRAYAMPMGLTDLAGPEQREFVKCQMETLSATLDVLGPDDLPKDHYAWTQRMYNILAHAQDLPKRDWVAQWDQECPG